MQYNHFLNHFFFTKFNCGASPQTYCKSKPKVCDFGDIVVIVL